MEYIDSLQSEPTPEPVIEEVEETKVHPLLQAMRELKEEGIVESVDPNTIFNQVKKIHHTFQDIEEGDLPDRIYWFDEYKKTELPLSHINLDEFGIDEQLVDEYADLIKASPNTMPPIVFDPIAGSIIDGAHRANAYAKLGYDTIPAYVGLTKSDTYGEREEVDEEIAYHGTADDINEFHPLTHFGTEKAAKDRMLYKKIKDGKIYKVDLDIKNPLTIKDFPGIHYDRLYAFELKDKRLISQEEMEDITFTQDKSELRKKLLAKLKELGIDGFVYKNKYEDKGNLSYVIVDPRQVKVLSVEPATEEVTEASPDTLEGSFTPDLVESKTWLAKMLAKGLKGKNAGTIYVLGSWYGNMGIFLQQAGVKFDKLVLVEPDEEKLLRSKDLLQQIGNEGKLILIHQNAEDVVYEKPGVVINTSCNETGPVFLTKLPDNILCLLQARNNADDVLIDTNNLGEFKDLFPLKNVYYSGQKDLTDPETDYTRYMIIGRSGKKLDETSSTGQGGGSAGNGGAQMIGGPTTYEQEYNMFKSKGPRRIVSMTEALDSSYPYEEYSAGKYHFVTDSGVKYKVYLQGKDMVEVAFSAILPGEEENFRPDKTTLTGTGDSRKVFGTVVKIVKEYLDTHKPNALYFTAENAEPSRVKLYNRLIAQVDKELPNYKALGNIDLGSGTAYMLRRKEETVNEALDSSYEYRPGKNPGDFYFDTEDGTEYKVSLDGDKKHVYVSFYARGQGDEHKVGLTGTGNSRKIFGTVINIVQNYINKAKPGIIAFSGYNGEPSRLKLYKMLASKVDTALPDYKFAEELSDGQFTTYYLTRNDVKVPATTKIKAKTNKALDAVFENTETTSLDKIYHGMRPDHDEMIWNYVGDSDFDTEFPIETINPTKLGLYLKSQYRIEDLEELFDMMEEDQEILVNHYMKEPNLSNEIIVMYDGKVIDGNHRALAAALTNKPIRYIDVGEEEL